MSILKIPYVSQITGPGAGGFANDCGPACVTMFITGKSKRATVGEVYQATGVKKDQYINGGQLVKAAAKWGIPLRSMYFDLAKARAFIDQGRPLIALVRYGTFSSLGKTESKFRDAHFLNVVGYKDKSIIVHDPLWRGNGGLYLEWSDHIFYQAWHDARLTAGGRNPSFWGLLCDTPFEIQGAPVGSQPGLQPQDPDVWGTAIILAHALRLRHHAPNGETIAYLTQGMTVDVLEPKKDGWYHVRWQGVEGWCGGNPAYITVTQRPPTEPPVPDPDPAAKKFMELPESERWGLVQTYLVDQGVLGKDGFVLK